MLNDRYEKVSKLGAGTYGSVYKAVDRKPSEPKNTVNQECMKAFVDLEKKYDAMDEEEKRESMD